MPTRKNFPSRKNARRRSALDRLRERVKWLRTHLEIAQTVLSKANKTLKDAGDAAANMVAVREQADDAQQAIQKYTSGIVRSEAEAEILESRLAAAY